MVYNETLKYNKIDTEINKIIIKKKKDPTILQICRLHNIEHKI